MVKLRDRIWVETGCFKRKSSEAARQQGSKAMRRRGDEAARQRRNHEAMI